jgi:hypothetical protein
LDEDNLQKNFIILKTENQKTTIERNTENNTQHGNPPRNAGS